MTMCLAEWSRGARARRLLSVPFACVVVFALYILMFAANARADSGALPTAADAAGAGDSAGLPGGAILDAVPGADQATAAPAADAAAETGAEAATHQAAAAGAAADQHQPRNLVIVVRIDSGGDDGPIVQTNLDAAGASASNDSATTQSSAPDASSGAPAGGSQASTGQTASSNASAAQDQPRNIVISVRVNSPGNNGAITQTNAALAGSSAANTSGIAQGSTAGAAGGDEPTAAPDATRATGPPAEQRTPPPPSGTAGSTSAPTPEAAATPASAGLVGLPAPVGPRSALAAKHSAGRPAAAGGSAGRLPSRSSRRIGNVQAPPAARLVPAREQIGATAPVSVTPSAVQHRAKAARTPAAAPPHRAARRGRGIRNAAADVLRSLAPKAPLRADETSKDVSSAVLLTLIAIVGALVIFAGSTYLPAGRRLLDPRRWRGR
jgi:hypothetical protein